MLLRRGVRTFADDAATSAAAASGGGDVSGEISRRSFLEKFTPYVSSTTAPPSFPTDFLPKEKAEETTATAGLPDKLKFSFYLPHGQPVDRQPVSCASSCNCGGALDGLLLPLHSFFSARSHGLSTSISSPPHAVTHAADKGGGTEF